MFFIKTSISVTGGMTINLFTIIVICISTLFLYRIVNNSFNQRALSPFITILLLFFINFISLDLIIGKVFFPNGEYHDYGLIGAYMGFGIILVPLILSFILYRVYGIKK